jgi:hypothetical protein
LWAAFPELSGTRFQYQTKMGPSQLVDAQGKVVAAIKRPMFKRAILVIDGTPRYQWRRPAAKGLQEAVLEDLATGQVVVTVTGRHFNFEATTQYHLRSGPVVGFRIYGASLGDAVMVAQDSTGQPIAHFRLAERSLSGLEGWIDRNYGRQIYEIVVEDRSLTGDDLLITLIFGAGRLPAYFTRPGGGG